MCVLTGSYNSMSYLSASITTEAIEAKPASSPAMYALGQLRQTASGTPNPPNISPPMLDFPNTNSDSPMVNQRYPTPGAKKALK